MIPRWKLVLPAVALVVPAFEGFCGPAKDSARPAAGGAAGKPADEPPPATWGYFLVAPDAASVRGLLGARKHSLSVYRVEKVVPVRGKVGVSLRPGATVARVEMAGGLPRAPAGKGPSLLFRGAPQHLQYTTREQRDDLAKRSRPQLPPSKDTVAVIIPIRKVPAWWALAHDERNAYFRKRKGLPGHTAIGAEYVDRIHRKLYHARYAVKTADHDFITYFEFERAHEGDFKRLLAALRDVKRNPEWGFVDREYEIWLTKLE
jgi:hypothetical protein